MEPIELPLSKSVALRAMTLNVVSELISGTKASFPYLPDAGDVCGMQRAVDKLESLPTEKPMRVNIGEGGAPFRFFTALAASIPELDLTLTTQRPLIRRPHAILLDTLREAGGHLTSLRRPNRPPLRIRGRQLHPGRLTIDAGVSSQFISALMMAAPLWGHGLKLSFDGHTPVSLPYLEMTRRVMEAFDCEVEMRGDTIKVAPGKCKAPQKYEIPTDWSAASYFYEFALLLPGREIRIARLTPPVQSLQGDSRCEEIFKKLGVTTTYHPDGSATLLRVKSEEDICRGAINRAHADKDIIPAVGPDKGIIPDAASDDETYVLDLNGTPDLTPALAVGFCLAGVRFRFERVSHLRHKETDRMAALAAELRKLGYVLWTAEDEMGWYGERCQPEEHPVISTYSDHRMAMAFAPAKLHFPELQIEHPEVTAKSFPDYWQQVARIF